MMAVADIDKDGLVSLDDFYQTLAKKKWIEWFEIDFLILLRIEISLYGEDQKLGLILTNKDLLPMNSNSKYTILNKIRIFQIQLLIKDKCYLFEAW